MKALGLRSLSAADVAPAFSGAGVLPQAIAARVSLASFAGVNTAQGRWALLDDLAAVPDSTAPSQLPLLPPPPAGQRAAALAPQQTSDDLQHIVRSAAAEVLGEDQPDGSGHFPAGAAAG